MNEREENLVELKEKNSLWSVLKGDLPSRSRSVLGVGLGVGGEGDSKLHITLILKTMLQVKTLKLNLKGARSTQGIPSRPPRQ